MAKKNCNQVNIPTTDNSSQCTEFNYSECITMNRDSKVVKNIPDSSLNEYLELLENQILILQNKITALNKKYEALSECCGGNQSSGIGKFQP
jgi:hypothetical protein